MIFKKMSFLVILNKIYVRDRHQVSQRIQRQTGPLQIFPNQPAIGHKCPYEARLYHGCRGGHRRIHPPYTVYPARASLRFRESGTHHPRTGPGTHFQTCPPAKCFHFHFRTFAPVRTCSASATCLEETRPLQPVWRKHRPRSQLHPPRRQSRV